MIQIFTLDFAVFVVVVGGGGSGVLFCFSQPENKQTETRMTAISPKICRLCVCVIINKS